MSSVRIQTGATERIEALALSSVLAPLTGLIDLLVSVRRISDGYFLDWNDMTFKNVGWTTRQIAMTEVSSSNAPGEYYQSLNTGSITNPTADDTYEVRVEQSPGTTAKNMPQTGEVKVGQFVDNIDAAISSRAAPGTAMDLITDAVDANAVAASGAQEIRDAILSDSTPFAGASIAAILTDTNETQTKLPTNNIMGSSVKTDKDDEIDAIKAKTDPLPSDPADQSLVDAAILASQAAIRGTDNDDLKDISDQIDALPTASGVATQVWNEPLPGAFGAGTAGKLVGDNVDAKVSNVEADTQDIQSRLPAALVSGRISSDVGNMQADTVSANAISTAGAQKIRDQILSDSTPFAGANINATISSRATPADVAAAQAAILARLNKLVVAAETTAAAGSTSTSIKTGLTQANDFFNNMQVVAINVAGVAVRNINDYVQASGEIVVDALPFTPTIGDSIIILARTGSVPVNLTAIAGAVWAEALPGAFGAGSAGFILGTYLNATISSVNAAIAALNDLSVTDVQTALTNQGYTSGRAVLLDNLDKAISALNDLSIADIQTALTAQGYTVGRAPLLDNLNATISSVLAAIAALNDLSQADVQTAMTTQGYTTVRAALLDNLDAAVSLIPSAVDIVLTITHGAGSWQTGTDDWTTSERSQIRDALGIDGTKVTSTGGKVQDILADTNETQTKLPTNNIMGSAVKTDKDDEIDIIKSKTDNLPVDPAIEGNVQAHAAAALAAYDPPTKAELDTAVAPLAIEANVQGHVTSGLTAQGYTSARAAMIELSKKIQVNRLALADGLSNNWVLYDDDDATPLLTFSVADKTGAGIIQAEGAPSRRTRGA